MEDVDARISAIEGDREHGAAFLTAEAMSVLSVAASTRLPPTRWGPCLVLVAKRVAAAKPAMAGLRNATDGLLKRLLELGPAEGARRAKTLSDELVAELRASARSAAANAARLLPPDATVATCSYSSAVIRACKAGREAGSTARVC